MDHELDTVKLTNPIVMPGKGASRRPRDAQDCPRSLRSAAAPQGRFLLGLIALLACWAQCVLYLGNPGPPPFGLPAYPATPLLSLGYW